MPHAAKSANKNLIRGATGDWEVVIGMEVHAQVASKAKLFSGASTEFGGEPNSHVSLVDAAMPGMLPVINEACIAQAVRTGLGLNAQINLVSVFDRKNYFYPDLPQGYQISQYKRPIVGEGEVEVDVDGESVRVGIERLHLEQDAGKSIHDQHPEYTYVDLNRSGVALMEIVSKPDMRSAKQAQAFVSKVRTILRYLGTCDGDMEKGNLRADVNVSVRKPGAELGTRCEIKNVNSIRFIGQAIEYEARRQIDIIEDGGAIEQETRLFDSAKGETRSMRSKEEAHDYRYFPDPDLLPLELTQDYVDGLKKRPAGAARREEGALHARLQALRLRRRRAGGRARERRLLRGGREGARWQDGGQLGHQRAVRTPEQGGPRRRPRARCRRASWAPSSTSSPRAPSPARSPRTCSRSSGARAATPPRSSRSGACKQVTDTGAIETAVDAVIAANPDKVAAAKAKPAMLGWFVGQVMKSTGGKANPQAVNELLKKKLDEDAHFGGHPRVPTDLEPHRALAPWTSPPSSSSPARCSSPPPRRGRASRPSSRACSDAA